MAYIAPSKVQVEQPAASPGDANSGLNVESLPQRNLFDFASVRESGSMGRIAMPAGYAPDNDTSGEAVTASKVERSGGLTGMAKKWLMERAPVKALSENIHRTLDVPGVRETGSLLSGGAQTGLTALAYWQAFGAAFVAGAGGLMNVVPENIFTKISGKPWKSAPEGKKSESDSPEAREMRRIVREELKAAEPKGGNPPVMDLTQGDSPAPTWKV